MALKLTKGTLEISNWNWAGSLRFQIEPEAQHATMGFSLSYAECQALAELIVLELKKVQVETRLIAAPAESEVPF